MKQFKTEIDGKTYEVDYNERVVGSDTEFAVNVKGEESFDFKVSNETKSMQAVQVQQENNTWPQLDIANRVYDHHTGN